MILVLPGRFDRRGPAWRFGSHTGGCGDTETAYLLHASLQKVRMGRPRWNRRYLLPVEFQSISSPVHVKMPKENSAYNLGRHVVLLSALDCRGLFIVTENVVALT